jgi:hypothetical protein
MKSSKRSLPETRRSAWASVVCAVVGSAGAASLCDCASSHLADCELTDTCQPENGIRCQEDVFWQTLRVG